MQIKPDCVSWSAIRSCAEQCGVVRRGIWGHDLGHADTHTNKAPMAGVQLVVHTSKIRIYTFVKPRLYYMSFNILYLTSSKNKTFVPPEKLFKCR